MTFPVLPGGISTQAGWGSAIPDRPIFYQKLDVDCIRVPRRNGNDQRLISTVHRLTRPAINSLEVVVHNQIEL